MQAGGVAGDAGAARARRDARTRIRDDIARDGLNNWGRIAVVGRRADLGLAEPAAVRRQAPSRSSPPSAAQDPIDTLCDYLIEDKGATRVLVTSISEDDVRDLVRSPTALVGSDGNCVATYGTVSQGMPHPRFYGTFPRIIGHYVRRARPAAARDARSTR